MRSGLGLGIAGATLAAVLALAPAAAAKKKEPLVVCKQGCEYRTIQDAVDASRKNDTIQVEPGKYREGVVVEGKKHNGLTIEGVGRNPKRVILEGKNATTEDGSTANHGIEGIGVKKLSLENMWARNYATNGFFVHECSRYLMKDLRASFNRAYGMYAFDCVGGRMSRLTGYGHGDSAFYIGSTRLQSKPKPQVITKSEAYKNVIGFSGSNSRYVTIKQSDFYNNGVGLVPNTLDSLPFEPSTDGVIKNNDVFWNNFNYFAPGSPVQTTSDGLGEIEGLGTINFPTGVGIVTLGATNWTVEGNRIFGHYKWGAATLSNPFNEGLDATSLNNQFLDNQMGRDGTDTNAYDFFSTGSGKGDCFSGNVSSTFEPSSSVSDDGLYPACPAPDAGTGTAEGYPDQFAELATYVLSDPPETQECSWTKHGHPPFENFKPYEVPGVTCP